MAKALENVELLKGQIEKAFDHSQYPGDDNLVCGDIAYDQERQDIQTDFKGKHWKEVSSDTLHPNNASLWFFTPEAFRFYLPAYLIESLDWKRAGMVGQSLINSLSPPPYGVGPMHDFLERVSGLSPDQDLAIKTFLEYLRDEYSEDFGDDLPSQALKHFWNNPSLCSGALRAE